MFLTITYVVMISQLDGDKSHTPAKKRGFVLHLTRSTPLDPAAPVCWCGQSLETMAASGRTLMSSSPTRPPSEWPSRRRWAGTCGQTSPWMTSPTRKSVWLEVKTKMTPISCPFGAAAKFPAHILQCSPSFGLLFSFHVFCPPSSSSVSITTLPQFDEADCPSE